MTYFRSWQIDNQGNIREIPFPETEPSQDENRDNIYSLNPHYGGLFSKKIEKFELCIFNWKPRDFLAEKQLEKIIRVAIINDFDPELIEKSGGIDKLMSTLDWYEWW